MSQSSEVLRQQRTVEEIFADIEAAEPKPIASSVPANVEDEKVAFLNDEKVNPEFVFDKLEAYDFEEKKQKLLELKSEAIRHPLIEGKQAPIYAAFIDRHLKVLELMQLANQYNLAESQEAKEELATFFSALNLDLYGAADRETTFGLIAEKKEEFKKKNFDEAAANIYADLLDLLPETSSTIERFKPSEETVLYIQEIAKELFGNLLKYVDDEKEEYSPEEIKVVFENILRNEFNEVADEWVITVEKATSINVVASEKKIKIPTTRKPGKPKELNKLVVHEIGVHFFRSLMGSQTDIMPLRLGFADYYEAEEGLGKVMEQAIEGKFLDSGIPYYLVAGLMAEGKDFRQVHEIMWRIKLLEKLKADVETTNEMIVDSKEDAFKTVLRVSRLTNGLAWNKDLSYYNGALLQWKFIQENKGDYDKLAALFYGKLDPSNEVHERLAYEAHSIE